MDNSVHFYLNYMKTRHGLKKMNYGNTGHIHINYRRFTNGMGNILCIQNHEEFYKVSSYSEEERLGDLLYNIRKPGHYDSNPQARKLSNTSIVDNSVHFWGKDMKKIDSLKNLYNGITGQIHRKQGGLTSYMDKVPSFTNQVVFYNVSSNSEGVLVMLRTDQKNLS